MESAQEALRITREQAEGGRRERQRAELGDLLGALEGLEAIASEVEEDTATTRRVMQVNDGHAFAAVSCVAFIAL